MHRIAWTLCGRALNSEHASVRIGLDEQADMTLDDRIAAGDREAIHDAIVEACEELDEVRCELAVLLVDDAATLDRLAEVRRARMTNGDPPIVRPRRRKKQETAGSDASGKERQRSHITGSQSASHGR